MKKVLSVAALLAVLVLTLPAHAQAWTTHHNAITASADGRFIPTGGSTNVEVMIYSASTSTSSIPVMVCAKPLAATCVAMTTPANVSSTPTFVNGPASSYLYLPVTVSAGAVTALYRTDSGPRLPGWKTFAQYGVATSTTGDIAVAAGKSAAISNSLPLAGTDSTTMTFPSTNATVARTDAANTFTGAHTFSASVGTNHYKALYASPPTITGGGSTCGTTAPSFVGGDTAGTLTVGSVGGTSCVITFGTTWTTLPACTVNRVGVAAGDLVVTPAATTLTVAGTLGAGEKFVWICVGY